ncbi:unnamed protein product [Sphagnum jensenii]|uniref:Uncharacterized protein n=1 Tax=Sphagnum jensenii TaxID=128206 RepID=A0ABP1AKD0_9BRYO
MGNGRGLREDAVEPPVPVPSATVYDSLADYEAACKADPDVKKFDDELHSRTQKALASLAASVEEPGQGVSFKSLKDITVSLLEVDKEAVDVILNCKKDVWQNKALKELVKDYFDTSLNAVDFCGELQKCIHRTRDRQLYIQELKGFAKAADPFLDDFNEQFKKVHESHLVMQKKLELKNMKLDNKLGGVRGWLKVSNVTLAANCTSVILCGLVSDVAAAAPEVAADLAAETTKHMATTGTWLRPFCSSYLRMKAKKQIVEDAFRGNYVAIQDLNNIKASVDRLENEIAAIVRNIRFGEERQHDPFSLQVAVVAIGWKQAAFIKLLEELQETVSSSHNRISRARGVVLERLLENREHIFRPQLGQSSQKVDERAR